ncbi:alpha/beta hydrolase family protein [Nocardioides abyssi]|uniref:AB hydrolase-1 domain-containing protein n=1 Tax=Nocardioides abyssi TaxID=3058370 RepID=A0ABT8ERU5_9ACTN|nr:alpha/beta fold hydrolase [Nocardioides abyssi]MDN4160736.1 hypothetical protein [Nocardioides abyssi]
MTRATTRRALVVGGLLTTAYAAASPVSGAVSGPVVRRVAAASTLPVPLVDHPDVTVELRLSGQGLVATIEPVAARSGPLPLAIYHHGLGRDTEAVLLRRSTAPIRAHLLAAAMGGYRVVVSDFGGFLWGNECNHRHLDTVIRAHRRAGGAPGPVALIGSSMGGAAVLSYAGTHRRDVACVVALQPALNLAALRRRGVPVDRAFGGRYSNAVHGPRSSPTVIARDRRSLYRGMPIRVWAGSLDHIATPALVRRFEALVRRGRNPQVETTILPGLRHGDELIGAVPSEDLVGFLHRHLPVPPLVAPTEPVDPVEPAEPWES